MRHIIYKTNLIPVGKGQLPDTERIYISEPLPHITWTKDLNRAYITDKEEAEELAYLTDSKIKGEWE